MCSDQFLLIIQGRVVSLLCEAQVRNLLLNQRVSPLARSILRAEWSARAGSA